MMKNKKIIIIIGIIFIFFIGLFYILKDSRKLTIVERIIKDSALTITNTVSYPLDKLKSKKNSELKQIENSVKISNQTILDNLKKEIDDLKKNMELNHLLSDYDSINASIISRNIGYWYDTLIIDKGSKDNIKPNMAVTVFNNLVGKIIKTTAHTSTVKLLTNNNDNKVSVQIKNGDDYVYGILTSYNVETNEYLIERISNAPNIELGSIVSTTGLGDIFPSGITVGIVNKIEKDNFDLEAILKVKPIIDVNSFSYVTVLKRK